MKLHLSWVGTWLLASALLLSACGKTPPAGSARSQWPGEQGDTYQSIARLPDWRGTWALDMDTFARGVQTATNPNPNAYSAPLNAKWEAYRLGNAAAGGGAGPAPGTKNNAAVCLPDGMPALMVAPHAFQFYFAPGQVTIVSENAEVRWIYTDGRAHPQDVDETWEGHSIGHWEGDTLVADTVGIKPQAEVFMGMPNASNRTHVVERIHLNADKKLQIDTVVDNPDQFTKPYAYFATLKFAPKGMVEYFCQENNRDQDAQAIDLTPPNQRKQR